MGGNFREKLGEVPKIKFRGFKFRCAMGSGSIADDVMNFELGTRGAVSTTKD